jgi:hypothetical protein
MFSGNRVEVLNHQPNRLATQLDKNVPFVGEMLIDHGVRIADLFSDLAKRHSFVAAIGKHLAGSRKDFAPQPFLALYPATWRCGCHFNSLVLLDDYFDRLLIYNHCL